MENFCPDKVLRISILRSNKVLANGAEVELDELKARLARLASQKGAIWIYQEPRGPGEDAPPIMGEVYKLICHSDAEGIAGVDIAHTPDFSDLIASYGRARPEE